MRTRRTAVAVVVLLLALLGACSSSKDIADQGDTTGPTTTTTTSTSPVGLTEPTTPSVSEPSTAPDDSGRLVGTAFSVAMPDGWEDITKSVKATQPSVDVAMGEGNPSGFRTNFNVVDSSTYPGTIEDNGPAIRREAATELRSITKKPVHPLPDRQVAGEAAIGQTSTFVNAGTSVTFIQYFVVHDQAAYPITMTFATEHAASAKSLLEQILASWHWVS